MRKLNIIKSLTDYLLLFSYIILPFSIILLLLQIINPSEDYSIAFFNNNNQTSVFVKTIFFTTKIIAFFFLTISLFNFRKTITTLQKRDFFGQNVYIHLKKTGTFFILYTISNSSISLINELYFAKKVSFDFPSSLAIELIIGLFFISISEIIQISSQIKEENDLTI